MTRRLEIDTLAISHGDLTVRLCPSLRAGLLIVRNFTVADLERAFRDLHFTTIAELIRIGSEDASAGSTVLTRKVEENGLISLNEFVPTLLQFTAVSLGLSDSVEDQSLHRATNKLQMTHEHALEELFGIGTGWLGWTPKDAWEATPAEIIAAHCAHLKKLQAIHGGGDKGKPDDYDPRNVPTPKEVQANLAAFKQKVGTGQ
jgi:hypothetical protein